MTLIPEVRAEIHATARGRASATAAGHSARNRWRPTIGSQARSCLPAAPTNRAIASPPRRPRPRPQLTVSRTARPAPPRQRVSPGQPRQIGGVSQFARGVYIRYIRRGHLDGVTHYLIPAANITQVYPIPSRCYREQLRAFRALARTQPTDRQAALIAFETRLLKSRQARLQPAPGVCLVYHGRTVSGTGPCSTAASLRDPRGALASLPGSGGNDHGTVTTTIVPDNVATVTAHYDP
jgi:hypothetical protein